VNKNGVKNDEIPFAFAKDEMWNAVRFFAKSFMPFVDNGIAVYDGKVTEQYRLDEFKETLRYMNSLYKEGLIKEDSFTMTQDQMMALGESPTPILAVSSAGWPSSVVQQPGVRFTQTFVLPPLRGPSGQAWAPNTSPYGNYFNRAVITNRCKNPELAIALYDYLLDFAVANSSHLGPKGTGWADPDAGMLAIDGGPARAKLLSSVTFGVERKNMWGMYAPLGHYAGPIGWQAPNTASTAKWLETGDPSLYNTMVNDTDYSEIFFYQSSKALTKWEIPVKYFLPPLAMNDADNTRISDINAVLAPYKDQAVVEFITGIRNIDRDWNAYLADLDRLGSKNLVSIYQKYVK
jgi:putative aldouronate transport system substrate-binding protein